MNKSSEISRQLIHELSAGRYPPDSRFPSEYSLARRFNVSRLTANKVVSSLVGAGYLVRGVRGSGTRVARAALHSKGRIIYLGSILHPNEVKALQGILSTSQANGYTLEIAKPAEQNLKEFLMRHNGDNDTVGIVTIGYWNMPDEYCPRIPMIYLDMPDPIYHADKHYVATPNLEASKRLMGEFLSRGHREIVIYTSPNYQFQHATYRVQGFQETMRRAGIRDVEKRTFAAMDYTDEDAVENLRRILSRYPKTTLVATTSDDLVRTMLQAMKALGIPHPGPITLTGFGNISDISTMHQIPTVEQNYFQIGVQACTALIDLFEKRCGSIPNIQYVDCKMVNLECIRHIDSAC